MAPVRELSSDTRAQIIGLHEAGHQTGEISRLVGASKATVKRWAPAHVHAVKRYEQTRL